jgi:hypothetical protein
MMVLHRPIEYTANRTSAQCAATLIESIESYKPSLAKEFWVDKAVEFQPFPVIQQSERYKFFLVTLRSHSPPHRRKEPIFANAEVRDFDLVDPRRDFLVLKGDNVAWPDSVNQIVVSLASVIVSP